MIRRVLLAAVACSLVVPGTAHAATEAQLRRQLEDLKAESRKAGEEFSDAHWALDETEVRIAKVDKKMRATRKRLAAARRRLNARAEGMYRREELDALGFLVGASDFEDFMTRLDRMRRIGEADAQVISEVVALQTRLRQQREELKQERRKRSAGVAALRSRRDRLLSRLKSKEREFRQVKARLDAVRSGGSPPSGVAAVAGPNGMVFPVVGSYYYSNTWGASRSGGRRSHQGTDIMSPRGTPIVAILSGTVRSKSGGLGGRTIWLSADNGWQFYYAHLDRWVVTSGRVRAGQVIATVGSTGNAAGGSPHLHLQIHPGGGGPVNPYGYLRSME